MNTLPLRLCPVDDSNLLEVLRLSVRPEQAGFVASNSLSLCEAYVALSKHQVALPFAICAGPQAIGFVMIGYDSIAPDDPAIAKGNYCLWRLMIDQCFQGHGYGRQAMTLVLDYLHTLPAGPADCVWLSYEPENAVACKLYRAFGFRENGELCGDEIVAVRPLARCSELLGRP